MILRLLSPQGIAGLVASVALAILLLLAKVDARHWKKQSSEFEQLYRGEEAAFAATIANYRAAAETARASDQANASRVVGAQRQINERTDHDFETRLAVARAAAAHLLRVDPAAAADPGARANPPVSGLSAAAGGPPQGTRQDRLPASDALTATEQAIQLDELIKWVEAQAAVDPNSHQ
jgi:hypothetical protein